MKKIVCSNTYHLDIIEVPDEIAENINKYIHMFDKWLYNKDNDHGYWILKDGKKWAVSCDTEVFVHYLNEVVIEDDLQKVRIIKKELAKSNIDKTLPVIYL